MVTTKLLATASSGRLARAALLGRGQRRAVGQHLDVLRDAPVLGLDLDELRGRALRGRHGGPVGRKPGVRRGLGMGVVPGRDGGSEARQVSPPVPSPRTRPPPPGPPLPPEPSRASTCPSIMPAGGCETGTIGRRGASPGPPPGVERARSVGLLARSLEGDTGSCIVSRSPTSRVTVGAMGASGSARTLPSPQLPTSCASQAPVKPSRWPEQCMTLPRRPPGGLVMLFLIYSLYDIALGSHAARWPVRRPGWHRVSPRRSRRWRMRPMDVRARGIDGDDSDTQDARRGHGPVRRRAGGGGPCRRHRGAGGLRREPAHRGRHATPGGGRATAPWPRTCFTAPEIPSSSTAITRRSCPNSRGSPKPVC